MRRRYKPKGEITETGDVFSSNGCSPLPEDLTVLDVPSSPAPGLTLTVLDVDAERALDAKGSMHTGGIKRYLGVRVKMPVKDMLRNIRLAKGWDLQDLKENSGKSSKGEKKRVKTCGERRTSKRKQPTKSLEELAIIVEVLEEDLRTSSSSTGSGSGTHSPQPQNSPDNPPDVSPNCSPLDPADSPWGPEPHLYTYSLEYGAEEMMPGMTSYNLAGVDSPPGGEYNNSSCNNPSDLQGVSRSHHGSGCSSDESEDMVPSPQSFICYSPESYRASSPRGALYASCDLPQQDGRVDRDPGRGGGHLAEEWVDPQSGSPPRWNQEDSTGFFWSQLQREESQLRQFPDSLLLSTDLNGRTVLHRVVCLGKRAQGYAVAKRMAALNSLDLKDGHGMTALHLASKQNQHLMVADLIQLGASINQRDQSGKTCLHLSAENGYIRVLEVLKRVMQDGVYVDVEATDNNGLSVLQCAVLAQNAIVRDLERSSCPSQSRLLSLRKELMMETLECLLHMGSYLHSTPGSYAA